MKYSRGFFMTGVLVASFTFAHANGLNEREQTITAVSQIGEFQALKEAHQAKIKIYEADIDIDSSAQMQNQSRLFQINNVERYARKIIKERLMEQYPEITEEDADSAITAALNVH